MEFEEKNTEQPKNEATGKSIFIGYLRDFTIAMAVVMLTFFLLFRIIIVSGPSMQNTLMDGDVLFLVSRTFYRTPQRGDVIVASKDTFREGEPIIKRVIATEGQMVDIDFNRGIVYVDGVALEEPYISTPTRMHEGVKFPLHVEKGHVFVMGDNRMDSLDSRSDDIGLIDTRQILGKAVFLVMPGAGGDGRDFGRIGVIP